MNYPDQSEDKLLQRNIQKGISGVTLIELLLVIAIVVILGASVTPMLSRFVLQNYFDNTKEKVISSLRKSQAYAMDGKDGTLWGVCMNNGNIRLYSGSCNSPGTYEEFSVPSTVSIGGLTGVNFNSRGEPSSTVNVTISTDLESGSVGINSAGGFTIN